MRSKTRKMKFNFSVLNWFFTFFGKEKKIVRVLLFETFLAFFILTIIIGYFWIYKEYKHFKDTIQETQGDYISSQKESIRKETLDAVDYINFKRQQTDKQLKELLKSRTYEAISIAENIYSENKGKKPAHEIQKLIKDALRPIRFNNGRGYFFIGTLDGIDILYPVALDYEGKNLLDLQDEMGNYVMRDEISVIKTSGEGFTYGYWKKPGSREMAHQKISFIKQFKHFNWYIGTGEYIDDYTKDVQKEVLEWISNIRFGSQGYIFINTYNGDALITDGKLINKPKNLWELEDPTGLKVLQEERNAVKNPDGDFIYYSWSKLTSSEISRKISFVKGIPEWEWMVGSGVYIDDIDKTLVQLKAELNKSIRKNLLIIGSVLIILLIFLYVFALYVSKKAQSNIDSFLVFFKKAAHDFVLIDENKINFSEFKSLAQSANKMIREMKKVQTLKVEEEAFFEGLFESAPEAIVLIGSNNNVIRINKEFTRMFGFTQSEIQNKNVDDFIVPEELKDQSQDNFNQIECGLDVSSEGIRLRKDGSKIYVSILATQVIFNNIKMGGYVIYRNISNQKDFEQRLNEAKLKAEESDRLKTAFLTNMSHEIRTPMNAIIGFTALLKNPDITPDEKKEYLNILERSANNLLNIIDDIIDISRMEAEQLSVNKMNTNINTILDDLLINFENVKKTKEITKVQLILKKEIKNNDLIVYTDPKRFKQIFTHILDNAFKFTESGKIEFGYSVADNNLICYVKDTGIGIPNETKSFVFERFRQADETSTRKYNGTGLGLTISKSLVETMGGKMWFESEVGIGSSFYFSLPYKKEVNTKELAAELTLLGQKNWRGKKILIAEDAPTNFKFLEAILEKTNIHITWAKNGKEVLDCIGNNPDFDLILMDIQMPVLNGHQAVKQLKQNGNKIPIIAQTAYAMESDKQEIIEIGYDDFVIKPIEINLLLNKISKFLDK